MLLSFSLILFCLFLFFHILYMFIPLYTLKKRPKSDWEKEKGISVVIPAYNEELVIENCLNGIFNIDYEDYEVLFINDGSIDNTFERFHDLLQLARTSVATQKFLEYEPVKGVYQSQLYPHIWLIDKENGGKADALNAGIDLSTKEIVITLDADCILDRFALKEMNRTFSDDTVIAAGGLVNIVQGFKQVNNRLTPNFKVPGLIRYQVIQYLTAFYLHKTTQAKFGAITVIAGAFGAFQRSVLLQIKGYRKTVGEDMDITLKVQELIATTLKDKRIVCVPEAVCYTECPATFKNLYRQRIRWQKAFVDCIITYRKSFYKRMNVKVSTYLLFDSLILGTLSAYPTLFVPIIVLLTMNNIKLSLILFSMSIVLAVMQDIATIMVSRRFGHRYSFKDQMYLLLFVPVEVILYRITGLFFVTFGTILYFFDKNGWKSPERIGKPILLEPGAKTNKTIIAGDL